MDMEREEYENSKVKYDGLVNIYRTPPDDSNLMHDFQCMTIMLRNNEDTRNYLLTDANFELKQIPRTEEHNLENFELWQENVHPHKAFYFFDLLFGDFEITFDDGSTTGDNYLSNMNSKGYVFLRNKMGREWNEYEEYEARMEAEFNLSQEEIDERDQQISKSFAEIPYFLEKMKIEQSKGIEKVFLSIMFWLRKKTEYRGLEIED